MRRILPILLLAGPALAAEPGLNGTTGLLVVPTADVIDVGIGLFGASRHNPKPDTQLETDNYQMSLGLLPRLELDGRVVDLTGTRDLSLNAKYQIWEGSTGAALAVGAQDLGGSAQLFRSTYAVATLPWRDLKLSLGYGFGPDVLKGVLGGVEYRPWRFLSVLAEYDTQRVNAGLKLRSDPILGGLRVGLTAAYRGAAETAEYGAHLEFPLGRQPSEAHPSPAPFTQPLTESGSDSSSLRRTLTGLGFESVRVGTRESTTRVVTLENRRYNNSSADGIGLALGVIARQAEAPIQQIELTLLTYGVPQATVSVPVESYRAFLQDPASASPALREVLHVRAAGSVDARNVTWDGPAQPLRTAELVVEPVLRTFIATDYGILDYGVGVRARVTQPLGRGFIANIGVQAPIALSDDFHDGHNFAGLAPQAGPDLAVLQYLQKFSPQWTWLWSAGRMQIYQTDLSTAGIEEAWVSDEGAHMVRAKVMFMQSSSSSSKVVLGGYSWFDPARDYGIALTAGRFYLGDSGVRLEFNRYFGDTIYSLFFKAASRDDQAVGIQVSLPLTPRQDAYPGIMQLKGPRRWSHSASTTINSADGINHLRPLLLYEPQLDLDLRRDLLDSGRLGEDYLREELPRMHEAYELWGQ